MNRLLIFIIGLLGFCVAKSDGLAYSPDGGLVSFGKFDYVYDSASRLTEVWSNDTRIVENKYDALGRRFYSPRIARWLTRDPIGEDGGLNLYAACGNDMVNNVDFLGLYTLGDAQDSLARRKMPKTKRVGLSWIYFDSEVFNEWLIMERMRGSWWASLPRCPSKICIRKNGTPVNPDNGKWKDPKRMTINRVNHPGGFFEMRSLPFGHSANQCVYDKNGDLMRNQPAAGTVDYYSFPEYWWQHSTHDLRPFELARELGRIPDYYSVRPSW